MSEQKDTIYIDVDDDITSIIDKVANSDKKIVALVLPKRSTVMQSVVNMRLLKRTTENAGKSLVLITSESNVLPLAGSVGLFVATTLQSKPYIPKTAVAASMIAGADEDGDMSIDNEPGAESLKPVGELVSAKDEDSIEVDNETKEQSDSAKSQKKPKKPKKDKKLKIPNFDTFRKKLFLGIGVFILLGIGWYFAFYVMPSAKIIITTDTTTASVSTAFIADPSATEVNVEQKVVPAKTAEVKKDNSQKVPTTGEKNLGEKATGEVTLSLTDCSAGQVNIPAGTTVSSGSFNFITSESATLSRVLIGDECKNSDFPNLSTDKVKVVAQNGGDQYNLSARNYTVAGFNNVSGSGKNMSGGTNKIVKIVSQSDVDGAKQKLQSQDLDAAKKELSEKLSADGYKPVTETFTQSEPVIVVTPNVGAEANEVTVSSSVTYTMLGVQEEGLKTLVQEEAKKQESGNKQNITDYGLDEATFQVFDKQSGGGVKLSVKTDVVSGPQLDAEAIKKEVAGKRRGEIQSMLNQPGVKDVEVVYSPFWVTKTPNKTGKITIVFKSDEK